MTVMTGATNPVDALGAGIAEGLFDADLDRLARAVQARKQKLEQARLSAGGGWVNALTKYDVPVSTEVRIDPAAPIGPRYILGARCTVTRHRQKKVVVEFAGGAIGRFRQGAVIIDPVYLQKLA